MKLVKSLFVGLGSLLFCCNSLFAKGLYVEFSEVISDGTTTITMSDGVVLDGPAIREVIYKLMRHLQWITV